MPSVLVTGNAEAQSTATLKERSYNFTAMGAGIQPANNSWISFSRVNITQSFRDSVVGTENGNALDIYTHSFSTQSYLRMNISDFQDTRLSVNFSWNEGSSYGLTVENFIFFSNGSRLFNISYGINSPAEIMLGNASGIHGIAPLPLENKVYTLTVYFQSTGPGIALVYLKPKNSVVPAIPVKVYHKAPLGKNISMEVGGFLSNTSIYSVSENNTKGVHIPFRRSTTHHYNMTEFQLPGNDTANTNTRAHPFMDKRLNSVVYCTASGTIDAYDYYTSAASLLSGTLKDMAGGLQSGGRLFYWSESGSLCILEVNLTSLETANVRSSVNLSGEISAIISGEKMLLYNTSGNTAVYSMGNGTIKPGLRMDPLTSGMGYMELAASLSGHTLFTEGFSNKARQLVYSSYNFSTQKLIKWHSRNYSFLDRGIQVSGSAEGDNGSASLFSINNSLQQKYMMSRGGRVYVSPGYMEIGNMLSTTRNSTVVSYGGQAYAIDQDGNMTNTGIPANGSDSVCADPNLTAVALLHSHKLEIFYKGSSLPLSNSGIRVKCSRMYLLRGTSSLDFSVESSLDFSATLTLQNYSWTANNSGTFGINSSKIADGQYNATISATNIAGYSSAENFTVRVDNSIAVVSVKPANGSAISNRTLVAFNISEDVGVSNVRINYTNTSMNVSSGNGTFMLNSGKLTGWIKVCLQATDRFGVEHNSTLVYEVIGHNKSAGLSIWSGEYLKSPHLHLHWTSQKNATGYTIKATGAKTSYTVSSSNDSANLTLGNGRWSITLAETLISGEVAVLDKANITVIDFRPELDISRLPARAVAFYGDSIDKGFSTLIAANVTAAIHVKAIGPGGKVVANYSAEDSMLLNLTGNPRAFRENGTYGINVYAASLSGTLSETNISLVVNNTIPVSPDLNSTSIYTNKSVANIGISMLRYLNYTASMSYLGHNSSISIGSLGHLNLSRGQGIYRIQVTDFSASGNYNSSAAKVYLDWKPPDIKWSFNGSLTRNSYITMYYNVSSAVPLKNITLSVNGTLQHMMNQSGKIRLSFTKNGAYNVSLSAVDKCGNHNITGNASLNVSYFIHLISPGIYSSHSGSFWHFLIRSGGNGLSRVNTTWFINGKRAGSGNSVNATLGYGMQKVKAVISFQGKTIVLTRNVLILGIAPYAAGAVTAAACVAYVLLGKNVNEDDMRKLILENFECSFKSIFFEGKKRKMRPSKLKAEILEMGRKGQVSIKRDPDGMRYVMPPKNK